MSKLIKIALTAFLIFTGCSSNLRVSRNERDTLVVPAGVDSSVAARADSLADQLFVSLDREKKSNIHKALGRKSTTKSDTLWKYLSGDLEPGFSVTSGDSLAAIQAFNKGAQNLQRLTELEQNPAGLPEGALKAEVLSQLQQARSNFEQALILNPFDVETKSWLARVYQSLAVRFLDTRNHQKAVDVLENLLRIEKGEHALYARLAESYYALEDWESAYENFAAAESVLRHSAGLDFNDTQDVALDSSALFYYVYYQADTEIKQHQAQQGLRDLQRAKQYASTEKERQDIDSYIEWINWDDGNTRAVELRDQYIALQDEGKYEDAARGFRQLIPELKTRDAIDETVWRLAVLEFQYLDRKADGIDRLKHVVHLAAKDNTGAPVDPKYSEYFNSYGVMCHNLGVENSNKNRKVAFTYFQQAVAVDWENRAKSYLEIAKLSRNNPKAVIASCEQALAVSGQLEQTEQMQAYQLLVEALKRSGKFEQARAYYTQWISLRNAMAGRN